MDLLFSLIPEEILKHVLFPFFNARDFSRLDQALSPWKGVRQKFMFALNGYLIPSKFEYWKEGVHQWSLSRGIKFQYLCLSPMAETKFFFDYIGYLSDVLIDINFQRHCSVSDQGLAMMSLLQLPRLSRVVLDGCVSVSDEAVSRFVEKCTALSALRASDCVGVADQSLFSMSTSCPNLTELDLNGCWDVTDAGVLALVSSCPLLTLLDLSFCSRITDASLFSLAAHCFSLRHLEVQECSRLTIDGMAALAVPSAHTIDQDSDPSTRFSLSTLNVSYCGGAISDAVVTRLTETHSQLQVLKFANCGKLTDSSLMTGISTHCFSSLRVLSLFNCSLVTDEGVIALATHCPLLEWLDLFNCKNISDASLCALSRHCGPHLTYLNLSSCDRISDRGLDFLSSPPLSPPEDTHTTPNPDSCPCLTSIDLSYCSGITSAGVRRLSVTCKRLKSVNVFRCPQVMDASLQALYAPSS